VGGTGTDYFPKATPELEELVKKELEKATNERLNIEINQLIRSKLPLFERDFPKINSYLDNINEILKDELELERFLFGGSVSKHTYIEGLSDIDALVILSKDEYKNISPKDVLKKLEKLLKDNLFRDKVLEIRRGTLAITIEYTDNTQIQLLPAIREKEKILIPRSNSSEWKETNPQKFKSDLTKLNQDLNNVLVPIIKLSKLIIANLPSTKQLTGYHIESLAVEAFENYSGEKTPKSMLINMFSKSANRILSPIQDVTGQSRIVDEYLGKENSEQRQNISNTLEGIVRKMENAKSVNDWELLLEL